MHPVLFETRDSIEVVSRKLRLLNELLLRDKAGETLELSEVAIAGFTDFLDECENLLNDAITRLGNIYVPPAHYGQNHSAPPLS